MTDNLENLDKVIKNLTSLFIDTTDNNDIIKLNAKQTRQEGVRKSLVGIKTDILKNAEKGFVVLHMSKSTEIIKDIIKELEKDGYVATYFEDKQQLKISW